jgi:hypothetical protein
VEVFGVAEVVPHEHHHEHGHETEHVNAVKHGAHWGGSGRGSIKSVDTGVRTSRTALLAIECVAVYTIVVMNLVFSKLLKTASGERGSNPEAVF